MRQGGTRSLQALGGQSRPDQTVEAVNVDRRRPPLPSRGRRHGDPQNLIDRTRLRLLMERTPVAVWTIDTELRITSYAGTGLKKMPLEDRQLVGLTLSQFLGTPDPAALSIALHRRALAGEAVDYETEWQGRTFRGHLEALHDEAGTLIGAIGIAKDVTEQAQAYAALHRSEERYRALVENLNDVIFTIDPEGTFTYVSPAIERISDYRPEEMIGQPFSRFVHPDDLARVTASLARTLAGQLEPAEFRVFDKQGQVRHVRTSTRPYFENGRLAGGTGVLTDITERKQVEDALRRSEQRHRTLTESAHDLIAETNLEGQLLYVSPNHREILGYEPDELTGRRGLDFTHPDDTHNAIALFSTDASQALFRLRHKSGEWRWFEGTGKSFVTTAGERRGVVISRDVTERKWAEERAAVLVQELERANRLKSEFVATMSHELRTPLNTMMGYTDLLLEGEFGPLTAEQTETLRRVEKSTQTLHELISATLDLSRLEAGQVWLDLTEIRFAELIQQIDAEMNGLRHKPNVSFAWNVATELPRVRTDAGKLKVVIKNLIANALKFTERGSVTVSVHALDGGVEIAVVDTGIGIAPETLPIIFECFRQAEPSLTRRYAGVGLGLYIVRRLLGLLGGTIAVESTVGRGSTFHAWLPLSSES